MTMREKLADILGANPNDYAAADAIIAALPGMVKPLEWEGGVWHKGDDEGWMEESKDHTGNWYLVEDYVSGYFASLSTDEGWKSGPHDTPEAAKAAAQAHHVAQILGALGVTV